MIRIHIPVQIPSKKNKLRPRAQGSRGRRYRYDAETAALIDAITTWARKAWAPRKPILHPRVDVRYFYTNASQDRDGIWTTVLDCLKKAGVIFDDNIRWFNGPVMHHPALPVAHARDAGVVLDISEMEETDAPNKTSAEAGKLPQAAPAARRRAR